MAVTGSKGKGSTSILLASLAEAAGERVGLVTSPHACTLNERIRISGRALSQTAFSKHLATVEEAATDISRRLPQKSYIGPGGIIMATALLAFNEAGVTAAVYEAGRGGEFDETRLVRPLVTVLTPIFLEHVDRLGNTLSEIAATKARMAPPHSTICTARQPAAAAEAISSVAQGTESTVKHLGQDAGVDSVRQMNSGLTFNWHGWLGKLPNLSLNSPANFQAHNAGLAIMAGEPISQRLATWDAESVEQGLRRVRLPGRMQKLQESPDVWIDGAIGVPAATALVESLPQVDGPTVAVVCIPAPKDLGGVLRVLANRCQEIVVTRLNRPQFTWHSEATYSGGTVGTQVSSIADFKEAIGRALELAGPSGAVWLVGTQSFVGECLREWNECPRNVY